VNRTDAADLLKLIDCFIAGPDRSRQLADEIEGIVIQCFQEATWFDDVSTALAQFSPGGDEHYFDEQALMTELVPVAELLRESLAEES
jgi:hypothetical protein